MNNALSDLEKFLHTEDEIPAIIKAGLIHAQFETIHPFLDGNGRTGRMLITFYLWKEKILEKPVLFLSSYFKKYQQIYYDRLLAYHNGNVEVWIDFFLDGVIEIAKEAIDIAGKITDNFYMGVGMWGTAGMGVDYRDAATDYAVLTNPNNGTMNMVTNLQLMQFGVPLAYKIGDLSVAVTPILQYGSLDMDFYTDLTGTGAAPTHEAAGVSQDLAFGVNFGIAYEINGLTLGAIYVSQIDMKYKGQFVEDLSTPATLGAGVSYKMNEHTIALDYKQINWEDAKGYEDFGWQNQNKP